MRKKRTKEVELSEDTIKELVDTYLTNLSVVKTANKFNLGKNKVRKLLKQKNVLLTLSEYAKMRTGEKNPFFGKRHSKENKEKHSNFMKTRLGKLNPNYKHGKYLRRPRDFKLAEFKPIRNFVYNRDNYTCQITKVRGNHIHAHHLIPYWVLPEAFFDPENLITVSTEAHLKICHNGDWAKFNTDIVPDKLLEKYSISRERLNELAGMYNKPEAIVRPTAINETVEENPKRFSPSDKEE